MPKETRYRKMKNPENTMKADCPVYKKCGGCQLQNLPYGEQLSLKQRKVIGLLGRFGHVDEILGMDSPYHYRNKVSAAFGTAQNGKIIAGVYQSSTHRIVDTDNCLIEDEKAGQIIKTIKELIISFKLLPFDEKTGRGFLRHVLIRRGFATNQIIVVFVTASPQFPKKQDFLATLLHMHPEITTVVQNLNNRYTSMVLGERETVLYGKGTIEDILCGCRFNISAKSFYQINPVQTEKLYMTAMEFASLTGREAVFDAYCGVGTIGLVAAKQAKSVFAAELNADAVKNAKQNARLNNAENINFVCEDAAETMQKLAAHHAPFDVVFLDPPRAGCTSDFLKNLVKLAPDRIVYISCNPETQARDLLTLVKGGYKVKKIQPVDMFPHTAHVETVVLMSRAGV